MYITIQKISNYYNSFTSKFLLEKAQNPTTFDRM